MLTRALCLGLLVCSALCTGCATSNSGKTLSTWSWLPGDYRDGTEEETDEFEYVGEIGRGDRPKEYDPDPWWQKYMMSEKARDIEANLGIAPP